MITFFAIIGSYLIGSICSAIIISRLFGLPDPCTEGSKNPGATNVLRLAGKKYAIIVLLGDMLKGLLPVIIAKLLGASVGALGYISLAAVLGHMFPIFFGFKGGKGVATALGAIVGINLFLGFLTIMCWLLIARITRYSSVASMISVSITPFVSLYFLHSIQAFVPLVLMASFIVFQHQRNINRLFDGTEPKIDLGSKAR